ncbi:MAG: metallophosphoesterase family protein [Prochlorotrichaceae cyanobacterium]
MDKRFRFAQNLASWYKEGAAVLLKEAMSSLRRLRSSRFPWLHRILLFCVTILLACSQPQAPDVTTSPLAAPPSASTSQATPNPSLPAETQAMLASLGQPLFDPPRGDVRFVVISDLNSAYGSTEYDPEVDKGIALIPFWQPDMVVCSGDMVAGQSPTLTQAEIQAMWAAFDDHVAAPLRGYNLPYGFTIGNHDASSALGVRGGFLFQQERDLAAEYWNDPNHDPKLEFVDRFEFPFYYTFEQNGIFFLAWDGSSHIIPPDKLAWAEAALASDRAQGAKMRILLGHLPLYSVAIGRDQPGDVMENADERRLMLEKYNVHTYISGHHHAYYPAHRGKLQLLHMGILGSGPRPLIAGNSPPIKAMTVLDINFKDPDLTTYTTYDMQTMTLLEYEALPRFLTGHNGLLLRRDIEWEDLEPAEKAACESQLGADQCTPG